MREIKNLKISHIALVKYPSTAEGKHWLIKKSAAEDLVKLIDLYQDSYGEELSFDEIEKAEFNTAVAKEILSMLAKYVNDVPDELVDTWKKLSKLLIKFAGYGSPYPEKKGDEFSGIEKSKDKWKSLGMTGDQSELSQFIQKVSYILEDDLKSLHVDKSGQVHTKGEKKGIESSGGGGGGGGELDPTDKWPSFGPY